MAIAVSVCIVEASLLTMLSVVRLICSCRFVIIAFVDMYVVLYVITAFDGDDKLICYA